MLAVQGASAARSNHGIGERLGQHEVARHMVPARVARGSVQTRRAQAEVVQRVQDSQLQEFLANYRGIGRILNIVG